MTEIHLGDHAHENEPHPPAPGPHPHDPAEFDHDLNVRAILWTTAGVVATCILSAILMWGMFVGFDVFDRKHTPPPPRMMKTTARPEPRLQTAPEPSLQASPGADMDALRARDEQVMHHAGWADRTQGTVRVPIDLAIEVLAARGLPRVTTPPLAETAARGSYDEAGRPPVDQPSPGTLLPPPGMGMGSIGPPSAGAGQQGAPAVPEPMVPEAAPGGAPARPAPPLPRTPVVPSPPPGGLP